MLKACYFVVLAQEEGKPSVRNMAAMYKHITGKGIRREDVLLFLRDFEQRETVGKQRENTLITLPETSFEHKKGQSGNTTGNAARTREEPSRARHKVLPLQEKENLLHTHIAGAGIHAREVDAVADFVAWFVAAGVEDGAVPKHLDSALEAANEAQRSAKVAADMLRAYGRAECERRARLFFAALKAPKGRGRPWITTLSERWTWFEPRVDPPRQDSSPSPDRRNVYSNIQTVPKEHRK